MDGIINPPTPEIVDPTFRTKHLATAALPGLFYGIDPTKDLVFIFLSSRLHPDGEGSINSIAGEIATLIGKVEPSSLEVK